MPRINFGRRLRELRDRAELTQGELGEQLGVTATAVSHWERGRSQPQPAEIPDIAHVLGVSVSDFFDQAPAVLKPGVGKTEQALLATLRRALELGPERIEINVYVAGKPQERGTDVTPAEPFVPTKADRDTREIVAIWNDLTDEQRREWLQFAEAIRRESETTR